MVRGVCMLILAWALGAGACSGAARPAADAASTTSASSALVSPGLGSGFAGAL